MGGVHPGAGCRRAAFVRAAGLRSRRPSPRGNRRRRDRSPAAHCVRCAPEPAGPWFDSRTVWYPGAPVGRGGHGLVPGAMGWLWKRRGNAPAVCLYLCLATQRGNNYGTADLAPLHNFGTADPCFLPRFQAKRDGHAPGFEEPEEHNSALVNTLVDEDIPNILGPEIRPIMVAGHDRANTRIRLAKELSNFVQARFKIPAKATVGMLVVRTQDAPFLHATWLRQKSP
jgi:hypothetical protein